MTYTLEIRDRDSRGMLAVDLRGLLEVLEPKLRHAPMSWRVQKLEAIGDVTDRWPDGILAVEEQVEASTSGIVFSWQDLITLAESCEQIINLRATGTNLNSKKWVTLEIVDSDFCVVSSDDAQIVGAFAKQFQ